MFKASRDFIILSLDGSRAVEDRLEEGQSATALSIVDHYMGRPNSPHFNNMTLLEFARQYSMQSGHIPPCLEDDMYVVPRSRRECACQQLTTRVCVSHLTL